MADKPKVQRIVEDGEFIPGSEIREAINGIISALGERDKKRDDELVLIKKVFNAMADKLDGTYSERFETLKSQVNDLFVGDRIAEIDEKLKSSFMDLRDVLQKFLDGKVEEMNGHILKRARPGLPGKPGKDAASIKAGQIRDKLETLKGEERLSVKAIKGLDKMEKDMGTLMKRPATVGVSSRDIFIDIDISDQLDGSTKTFNIQAVWKIISVDLSSYPYGAMQKTTDYTWTPTSITFTDEITAATQLAAGQKCIITAIAG